MYLIVCVISLYSVTFCRKKYSHENLCLSPVKKNVFKMQDTNWLFFYRGTLAMFTQYESFTVLINDSYYWWSCEWSKRWRESNTVCSLICLKANTGSTDDWPQCATLLADVAESYTVLWNSKFFTNIYPFATIEITINWYIYNIFTDLAFHTVPL